MIGSSPLPQKEYRKLCSAAKAPKATRKAAEKGIPIQASGLCGVPNSLAVQLMASPCSSPHAPGPLQAMSRAEVLAFFDKDKALAALARLRPATQERAGA